MSKKTKTFTPALRIQGDRRGDEISRSTWIDLSKPGRVRKEFGPETDTRQILKRHGLMGLTRRQRPQFTETDFDIDLQGALTKIERAYAAFHNLPKKHRDNYATIDHLWQDYKSGFVREPVDTTITEDEIPASTHSGVKNAGQHQGTRQREEAAQTTLDQTGTPTEDR